MSVDVRSIDPSVLAEILLTFLRQIIIKRDIDLHLDNLAKKVDACYEKQLKSMMRKRKIFRSLKISTQQRVKTGDA